jgi:hypothetical protein
MVNVKTYAMKDISHLDLEDFVIGIHSNGWIHSKEIFRLRIMFKSMV